MLPSTKELDGFEIAARDGNVGRVRDVYFDDERWVIRHLVVSTGGWLAGREVLISPHSVERLDRGNRRIEVNLTKEQIEQAPGVDTQLPVSRQQETAYYDYYGYPYYWTGGGLWGAAAHPLPIAAGLPPEDAARNAAANRNRAGRGTADPHLRSSAEVTGYHAQASDGSAGHIDELLFDESSWAIRYAVVDTRSWWPGGQVLVDSQAIEAVDWNRREVRLSLSRKDVKSTPPYRPNRGREDLLAGDTTLSSR